MKKFILLPYMLTMYFSIFSINTTLNAAALSNSLNNGDQETKSSINEADSKAVRTFIHKHILSFAEACYNHAIKFDNNLSGRVWLNFSVDSSGEINDISAQTNDVLLESSHVPECMALGLKMTKTGREKITLTSLSEGESVTISYPIVLTLSEKK